MNLVVPGYDQLLVKPSGKDLTILSSCVRRLSDVDLSPPMTLEK